MSRRSKPYFSRPGQDHCGDGPAPADPAEQADAADAAQNRKYRLIERVELERANQELCEAMEQARACGYRAGSWQMRALQRAEQRLHHTRRRWEALVGAAYASVDGPPRDQRHPDDLGPDTASA